MLQTLAPLALVDVSISGCQGSKSVSQAILPITFVSRAIDHLGFALTMELSLSVVVALIVFYFTLDVSVSSI